MFTITIDTKQNQDGSFSPTTVENQNELEQVVNHGSQLIGVLKTIENEVATSTNQLNQAVRANENAIQRYLNTESNKQWIYNNEISKYNDLINRQNNLLNRINFPNIKLWRFKDSLYFRTYSWQLITNNHVEIQKELSCRFGGDIFIVNDINDVLRNNNQYRVNTIFIAINNIVAVEEEVFNVNEQNEIFFDADAACKRNLLAYTRFNKKRITR
jgi:predicted RND superfamily exporter protein